MDDMSVGYKPVLEEICNFDWGGVTEAELTAVARAYYYFSVQFRENLQIACQLHPEDPLLAKLLGEEADTDNLSPWPNIAAPRERLNHDEFMRRVLELSTMDPQIQSVVDVAGQQYLSKIRSIDDRIRAISIASYEDGGLESVFTAILRAKPWDTPLLHGFRHFLEKHIGFDSDPNGGHGFLSRHLVPDDSIRCVWTEFRDLLITSMPRFII